MDAPTGITGTQLGFTSGTEGRDRFAWARYTAGKDGLGFMGSYGGTASGSPGSRLTNEAAAVAYVSNDLLLSNSTVAAIVETIVANTCGTGLVLSSKPIAVDLGITEPEASDLARQIEARFAQWGADPKEADLSGRHSLHVLVSALTRSYVLSGEALFALPWEPCKDAETCTKIQVLDSRQLDRSRSAGTLEGGQAYGVEYDKRGRVVGYWIRKYVEGRLFEAAISELVPATTSWGRPLIGHVYDLTLPGMGRGLAPIAASLTPAHERAMINEYAVGAAALGLAFAMVVESEQPTSAALNQLNQIDPNPRIPAPQNGDPFLASMNARETYYKNVQISVNPANVTHLYPNDKLKINRAEAPTAQHEMFDRTFARSAAKASGLDYSAMSGDYQGVSFSSAKLSEELPHRITMRRRTTIVEPIYTMIFEAWLEEQIEREFIKLPPNAPPFWKAKKAYTACRFFGIGKVSADRKKDIEADLLDCENGLATLSEKLAERGLDFETVVAQRQHEKHVLEKAGLLGFTPFVGTVVTQNRVSTDETPAERRTRTMPDTVMSNAEILATLQSAYVALLTGSTRQMVKFRDRETMFFKPDLNLLKIEIRRYEAIVAVEMGRGGSTIEAGPPRHRHPFPY